MCAGLYGHPVRYNCKLVNCSTYFS